MATNPHGDPDDYRIDEVLADLAEALLSVHPFEIDTAMHCYGIPEGTCAACGDRASRSVYDLERQERTLLCGVCRR